MRILPALCLAACVSPQIGYKGPGSPVQVVDAATAHARGLRPAPLHVDVSASASASDDAAVGAFLRAAQAQHAALASDLTLLIGACRQPLAPIAQRETHPETVTNYETDTEQVPEQQCEQVPDDTLPSADGESAAIPSTHEECTTAYTTQSTTTPVDSTEDVTTTTWSLARAPGTCPPGGRIDAVEGTIYGAIPR